MSLNIAGRALTTNLAVLQTIGHNIANANTVGYSRQTTQLQQVPGQQLGNGYFGKGVEIASVQRSYDAFLTRQANATQTTASADAVRLQKMQQVEGLFPLGAGSLGTMLNNALNAWVDVQSSPADATARGVVISRSDELAARIRDTASRLDEIGTTAKLQSTQVVKDINLLAQQIAAMNDRIARSQSGPVPNDLLDQRDKLLADLGKKIQISTIGADDGTLTVFAAGSLPLVLGNKAASLSADRDPLDGDNKQVINFVQGTSKFAIQDEFLVGGELKGLQDFINKDLAQTKTSLGRMALALATEVNQQHQSGLALDGSPGGAFFNTGPLLGKGAATNTGTAAGLVMTVANGAALAASEYVVTYATGTDVTIQRAADGKYFNPALYSPGGSPPNDGFQSASVNIALGVSSVEFDGLTLNGAVGTAAGDRFLLRPAADAAAKLSVALQSPAELAVASRVSVAVASTNQGAAEIEATSVTLRQGSLPATPLPGLTLTFNAGTSQFALSPAPTLPATITPALAVNYTPGSPMTITYDDGAGPPSNQWSYQLTLRGQPSTGDSFALSQTTTGAVRYNAGNAQAVLALRDKQVFDGNTTLADGYVPVFSSVATKLGEVKFSAEFSQTQAASAETQRANQAGVNLDEEAAKLIQYQQAYQASAKYMGTVQSLFDTLMSAFR